jgi:hypothetical protein
MEQVLDWLVTFGHAMLAGMIALTPGTLFWLLVLGIYLAIRQAVHSGPYQRLFHRGQ